MTKFIDVRLLPVKLLHFCYWGGQALVRPYYVNLLHHVRLSAVEVSFLVGTLPLIGLLAAPAVGVLADRCDGGGGGGGGGGGCGRLTGFNRRCSVRKCLLAVTLCVWVFGIQGLGFLNPRGDEYSILARNDFSLENESHHFVVIDNNDNNNVDNNNNNNNDNNDNNDHSIPASHNISDPVVPPPPPPPLPSGFTFDSVFVVSLLCFSAIEFSFTPAIGLTDAITFAALTSARRHAYGRQRMCGTLGFTGVSLVAGALLTRFFDEGESGDDGGGGGGGDGAGGGSDGGGGGGIAASFGVRSHAATAFMLLACLALALVWEEVEEVVEEKKKKEEEMSTKDGDRKTKKKAGEEEMKRREEGEEEEEMSGMISKKDPEGFRNLPADSATSTATTPPPPPPTFRLLFLNSTVVLLLSNVLIFGALGGFWDSFYGLYLERELAAAQYQMGASYAVATVAEALCMFFSGAFHRKCGFGICFVIVYAGYVVRFAAYYFLTNPWQCLPVDALHALTFGLMWSTAASCAAAVSTSGAASTLQAANSGVFCSLGRALGSFVGGSVVGVLGCRTAFAGWSGVAAAAGIAYAVILAWKGRKEGRRIRRSNLTI